jgi:hypothetical protein
MAQAASSLPGNVSPDNVSVEVASVNGSGCPNGIAHAVVSSDNAELTVTSIGFVAQVGEGAEPGDFRRNCQINLSVDVPEGFTYAISEAEYRGLVDLADGASATEQTSYYFQGSSRTVRMNSTMQGPATRIWRAKHTLDNQSLVYAPCGAKRNLNINSEVRVTADASDPSAVSILSRGLPFIGADSVYRLTWKRC